MVSTNPFNIVFKWSTIEHLRRCKQFSMYFFFSNLTFLKSSFLSWKFTSVNCDAVFRLDAARSCWVTVSRSCFTAMHRCAKKISPTSTNATCRNLPRATYRPKVCPSHPRGKFDYFLFYLKESIRENSASWKQTRRGTRYMMTRENELKYRRLSLCIVVVEGTSSTMQGVNGPPWFTARSCRIKNCGRPKESVSVLMGTPLYLIRDIRITFLLQ